MEEKLELFCNYCNINVGNIKSRSRNQHLVAIRQVFSRNMRKDHTLKEIGIVLNRKYNNIIHYLKPKETKGIIHKNNELIIYYQQIWNIMDNSLNTSIKGVESSINNLHDQCIGIIKIGDHRGLLLEYHSKINYAIYILVTPLGTVHTHYGTIPKEEIHLFPNNTTLTVMKKYPQELKTFYDEHKL